MSGFVDFPGWVSRDSRWWLFSSWQLLWLGGLAVTVPQYWYWLASKQPLSLASCSHASAVATGCSVPTRSALRCWHSCGGRHHPRMRASPTVLDAPPTSRLPTTKRYSPRSDTAKTPPHTYARLPAAAFLLATACKHACRRSQSPHPRRPHNHARAHLHITGTNTRTRAASFADDAHGGKRQRDG